MQVLNSKHIYVTPPTPPSIQPPPPLAMPVQFVKPVSYEFRVAEHLNDDNVIDRVGLQVQVYEHDEYGSPTLWIGWTDVPRVKLKNGVAWFPPVPDLGTTP
jgi:hypothetical protein